VTSTVNVRLSCGRSVRVRFDAPSSEKPESILDAPSQTANKNETGLRVKTDGIALGRVSYDSCMDKRKSVAGVGEWRRPRSPKMGPIATTKRPLPTMWRPNAAGNFSNDEYSDMVMVKLMRAAPLKNPQITSQTRIIVQSVCSARTGRNRNNSYTLRSKYFTVTLCCENQTNQKFSKNGNKTIKRSSILSN
jgi:hypothetical protein